MRQRERLSQVRQARGERGIWQPRSWEHLIRDQADYVRYVEYRYINPVKHAMVRRVRDWPHSSFHRDARAGIFPRTGPAKLTRQINSARADECQRRRKETADYAPLIRPTRWVPN